MLAFAREDVMMEQLISIIIPVYNVEQYIDRCIKSVLTQTYRNLQIIIVNDGSKDSSVDKIIEYQMKDSRIEIYQKDNGGLSSARNYGLKYVKGDFVCFIDSDDWVSKRYIEVLYNEIVYKNADIACAGFVYVHKNKNKKLKYPMKKLCLNRNEAITVLCEGKWMTNHVWNKLYNIKLFSDIYFEEGRCFEDIYIMHELFDKANRIACVNTSVYFYFMRENSIIHEAKPQNEADIFIGYLKRYNYLKNDKHKRITLKYCAWSCYKLLYLVNNDRVRESDIAIAKKFWEQHKEIASLGIKYLFMYKCPKIYKIFQKYR